MPWARLDDQFPIHRKVGALSDASFRLHVEAICWCVRNLTDGAVSREDLPHVTRIKKSERYAAELVQRGVWHETADGWHIHDFLDYQPSKNQVQQDRASNTERQRRWRDQHKQDGHDGHSVSNGVTNGVTNGAPTRPDPTRTRPDPKGQSQSQELKTTGSQSSPSRGTRLPDDFEVTEPMKAWAREHTPVASRVDHDMFIDHWRSQSGQRAVKRDWEATWRNWMRRVQENRTRTSPAPNSRPSTTDDRIAHALDLGRRMQAEHDAQARQKELGA